MKKLPIILLLIASHFSYGQDKNVLQLKKYFEQELKPWTKSFRNFNLSDFKVDSTLKFDNNSAQNFRTFRKFLSIYKPIITYSVDSSKFIDIYSYQLNLVKTGKYFEANPELDQAVFLCDPKMKYWNRIYFGTSSQWIDDVTWISKSEFILVGILKNNDNRRLPFILLGDTQKQTLIKYTTENKISFQNNKGYSSPKLKKMKIKGL